MPLVYPAGMKHGGGRARKYPPDSEVYQLLVQWLCVERIDGDECHRRLTARGEKITQQGLRVYVREILGSQSVTHAQKLGMAIRGSAVPAPSAPDEAEDEAAPEAEQSPLHALQGVQKTANQALRNCKDPALLARLGKLVVDTEKAIQHLRAIEQNRPSQQVVTYFPQAQPPPSVYDPNDPASWPDNPYRRLLPDPVEFPPDRPRAWKKNPYWPMGRPSR